MRHSAKMRIVERFRLVSLERLEIETTITDPEALTKPWTSARAFDRYVDWTLTEHVLAAEQPQCRGRRWQGRHESRAAGLAREQR